MPPFHLCQPGPGASCGACCGLYNAVDHSRPAVRQLLRRQREQVRATRPSREAFVAVAASLAQEQPPSLFPDVRVCPLLGFLDEAGTRVGCLAHPSQTGGPDLRDCGVYTAALCQSFECPSFGWLTDAQARFIRDCCQDWYVYGLVVTDVEFVRACVRLIEDALGGPLDLDRAGGSPHVREAAARLFALKDAARGERGEAPAFGRFIPDQAGEPRLRTLDYERLGARACPEDDAVLALGFDCGSPRVLHSARTVVREAISRVVEAVRAG